MSENVTTKKKLSTKFSDFFKAVKGEFKKIVWPTKKIIFNNTGVVIAFILIIGVLIYALDLVFSLLFNWVMSIL